MNGSSETAPLDGGSATKAEWDAAVRDAMMQVGACCFCVAIYETRLSDAAPATKRKSMEGSRKLVGAMGGWMKLPQKLHTRMEVAIMEVQNDEKKAKLEALGLQTRTSGTARKNKKGI